MAESDANKRKPRAKGRVRETIPTRFGDTYGRLDNTRPGKGTGCTDVVDEVTSIAGLPDALCFVISVSAILLSIFSLY